MTFPKTEYEVYSKSEKNNFEQLNLELCKCIKINKSISINISENDIDKYNYVCYTSNIIYKLNMLKIYYYIYFCN